MFVLKVDKFNLWLKVKIYMGIIIEELRVKYIDQVAGLFNDLVTEIKDETDDLYYQVNNLQIENTRILLTEILEDNYAAAFIALDDEKPVGFISGQIQSNFLPLSNIPKVGYISGAYIKQGFRKKGIMKLLENRMIEFFKSKNLTYVDLNVINNNITGKRCWKELGYVTFREQMRKRIK
jgi:ribosomal protein S18 acetylase RimI-like enzyme